MNTEFANTVVVNGVHSNPIHSTSAIVIRTALLCMDPWRQHGGHPLRSATPSPQDTDTASIVGSVPGKPGREDSTTSQ